MESDHLRKLKKEADGLGIPLNEEAEKNFSVYLNSLTSWNKKINLFRRKDALEIIAKDFLDSLTICKYLPPETSLLDLGSGAGFPGIPVKIARPDLKVVLSEIREKKFSFLKFVTRTLGIKGLEVAPPGKGMLGSFDFIASRAFGSLAKLVETASPHLKKTGIIISMKGGDGEKELIRDTLFLKEKGWGALFVEHLELPILKHRRVLIGLGKKDVSRETI
jgi:16S rRNA (guanine527-N7)-methyltransferase